MLNATCGLLTYSPLVDIAILLTIILGSLFLPSISIWCLSGEARQLLHLVSERLDTMQTSNSESRQRLTKTTFDKINTTTTSPSINEASKTSKTVKSLNFNSIYDVGGFSYRSRVVKNQNTTTSK